MTRRTLLLTGVAAVIALTLGVVGVIAASRNGEALPGVTVAGVDVGGLGPDDAREALEPAVAARREEPVSFTFEGESFEITPEQAGLRVGLDEAVETALDAGRGQGLTTLRASFSGFEEDVELPVQIDDEALRSRVDAIGDAVERDISDGIAAIDPATLEITTEDPLDGVDVRRAMTVEEAARALRTPGTETMELPATIRPTQLEAADVDAAASQLRTAAAEPLVLRAGDDSVTVGREDVARLLDVRREGTDDDPSLAVHVTADAAEEVLAEQVAPLEQSPSDAGFDTPGTPPVTFDDQDDATWSPRPADIGVTPSQDGLTFAPEAAAEQLTAALREPVRDLELDMEVAEPELTTADAEGFGLDQLLSTFTTYHDCCAARVTNIQKLADLVDDTTLLPGEQFSINQISGVRECSKGFAAAGMILNGEIVDSCGGGVSQFGTTTVNAVFFAGITPDAYKPHSLYISRYPLAREATLNFPSPDIDVRFTNDTGAPIVVRTSYTGTSITVSFYGSTDVSEVRADVGQRTNFYTGDTIRRRNPDLPQGTEQVVQSAGQGFSVGLTRTVVEGGSSGTDDWSNTYSARPRVVEFN